ncbi:MAG TPA: hypothetical protein VGG28_04685 [Kofleriaceae bacterium]
MAEYTKDTRFSWGWVIGGAAIIWVMQFMAVLFWAALKFRPMPAALLGLAPYVLGGFVIGWQSEGRTILEAGLATLLVIFIELGRAQAALRGDAADLIVLLYAVPFVAAVIGAWLGELVQGNVVRTSDD